MIERNKIGKAARGTLAAGVSLGLVLSLAPAVPLQQAAADTPEQAATSAKLVKEDGRWHYYTSAGHLAKGKWETVDGRKYYFDGNGNAVTGAQKIKGKRYVFDGNGRLFAPKKTKFVKVGGKIYYVNPKGRPGAKKGWLLKKSTFYYLKATGQAVTDTTVDGIILTKDGSSKNDYASKCKLLSIKRINKLTKPSMSRKTKLKKCFRWLLTLPFNNATTPKYLGCKGWVQRRAIQVQRSHVRECWGSACTFAMMAYELGYKPTVKGRPGRHGYVLIKGKRWDSILSKPYISNTHKWKVLSWRDLSPQVWGKYAKKSKKSKKSAVKSNFTGLKTVKGKLRYYKKGKLQKKTWLTKGKRTYYFDAKGNAATGSVRAKRKGKTCYWIFGPKHVLRVGKGVHDVTVAGTKYRVRANGSAFTGWIDGHTKLYLPTGELATGVRLVSQAVPGGLLAFGEDGTYDADLTAKLQAAYVVRSDATELLSLLGTPKSRKVVNPNSCFDQGGSTGDDVNYVYDHITVCVFARDGGGELIESIA